MNNIYFCKTCVYPSSKPHIEFNDDGICSGCIAFQRRPKIDWKKREYKFKEIYVHIILDETYSYVIRRSIYTF